VATDGRIRGNCLNLCESEGQPIVKRTDRSESVRDENKRTDFPSADRLDIAALFAGFDELL
jgi:hypothetical protein